VGIEQLNQLGKICQRPRQAVNLVNDDDVNPVGANVFGTLYMFGGLRASSLARGEDVRPSRWGGGRTSSTRFNPASRNRPRTTIIGMTTIPITNVNRPSHMATTLRFVAPR
jgi:hypothetical protein